MSSDEKILRSLQRVETELAELRTSLTGDKLKGLKGILDILEIHGKELYGDTETQSIGLKDLWLRDHRRIDGLETSRVRVLAWSGGVSFAVSLVWVLVKTYLVK